MQVQASEQVCLHFGVIWLQVSRICTGASQTPVRLANGAIAKATSLKKETPAATPRGSLTSSATVKSTKYTLLKGDANDPNDEKGYKCSKCSQVDLLKSSIMLSRFKLFISFYEKYFGMKSRPT